MFNLVFDKNFQTHLDILKMGINVRDKQGVKNQEVVFGIARFGSTRHMGESF